ncbi:hypothetical protein AB0H87_37825, partial [Asanoa sp. NPDC050611]
MAFPDRIERTLELAHSPEKVWAALTTAEGLGNPQRRVGPLDLVEQQFHVRLVAGVGGPAHAGH